VEHRQAQRLLTVRRRLWAAAVAIASVGVGCTSSDGLRSEPSPTASASAEPEQEPDPDPESVVPVEAGDDGIGDVYFSGYGNGGYDVRHYDIAVEWLPDTGELRGRTTVIAATTQQLEQFNLDLHLDVEQVVVNGEDATFEQVGRELVVSAPSLLDSGARLEVEVTYAGAPGELAVIDGQSPWHLTSDGAVVAGEPEAASAWFPSNDHPRDKATFDIAATVPRDMGVVSNGRLVGVVPVAGNRSTTRWRVTSPMATYLAYVALGDFRLERGRTPGGIPYLNAISEHLGRVQEPAERSLDAGAEVLDLFEREFGAYPFDIAGGTLANVNFGFALENQTRPVYSKVFFRRPNTEVIAHELAHQWFGNSVSLHSWSDIWLNEGLAVWASWLYRAEVEAGRAGGVERRLSRLLTRTFFQVEDDSDFWTVRIGDPGGDQLFSAPVYVRGAMAVQALRARIGPPDHRRLLRTWVRRYADGNASVADFTALAEQVSGEYLTQFFHVWLYRPGAPERTRAYGF
jgi:aminopeptidase N